MNGKRVQILQVSPEFILMTLMGRHGKPIKNALPDDAKVIRAQFNFQMQTVDLMIESEAFEPIPEGSCVPYHTGITFLTEEVGLEP